MAADRTFWARLLGAIIAGAALLLFLLPFSDVHLNTATFNQYIDQHAGPQADTDSAKNCLDALGNVRLLSYSGVAVSVGGAPETQSYSIPSMCPHAGQEFVPRNPTAVLPLAIGPGPLGVVGALLIAGGGIAGALRHRWYRRAAVAAPLLGVVALVSNMLILDGAISTHVGTLVTPLLGNILPTSISPRDLYSVTPGNGLIMVAVAALSIVFLHLMLAAARETPSLPAGAPVPLGLRGDPIPAPRFATSWASIPPPLPAAPEQPGFVADTAGASAPSPGEGSLFDLDPSAPPPAEPDPDLHPIYRTSRGDADAPAFPDLDPRWSARPGQPGFTGGDEEPVARPPLHPDDLGDR